MRHHTKYMKSELAVSFSSEKAGLSHMVGDNGMHLTLSRPTSWASSLEVQKWRSHMVGDNGMHLTLSRPTSWASSLEVHKWRNDTRS